MKLALLLAAAVILIRDPTGKWANDPLRPWFEALKNKDGFVCCAEADGHPLHEKRLRSMYCAPTIPGDASTDDPDHKLT
jgi:hypothetical protein